MLSVFRSPRSARPEGLSRNAAPQIMFALAAIALTGSTANADSTPLPLYWERDPVANAALAPAIRLAQADAPASELAESRDIPPSRDSEARPVEDPAAPKVGADGTSQARADVTPEKPAEASTAGETAGPAPVTPRSPPSAPASAPVVSTTLPGRSTSIQTGGPAHRAARARVAQRAVPVSRAAVHARANVCQAAAPSAPMPVSPPPKREPTSVIRAASEPAPMTPVRPASARLGWGLPWSLARSGAAMVGSVVVWPMRYASGVLGL
jgi:hypothetical protein